MSDDTQIEYPVLAERLDVAEMENIEGGLLDPAGLALAGCKLLEKRKSKSTQTGTHLGIFETSEMQPGQDAHVNALGGFIGLEKPGTSTEQMGLRWCR